MLTKTTKLPLDIHNFEGKPMEYPMNHVMNFNLWCSSNNITDNSFWLRLFEHTLTCTSTKWYISEMEGSHNMFESLAKSFLTFLNSLFVMKTS